jgi:hypothetical protein
LSISATSLSTRSGRFIEASAGVVREGVLLAGEAAMTGEPEVADAAGEVTEAVPGRNHPESTKVTQSVATKETATSTTNRPLTLQAPLSSDAAARSAISLSFPSSRGMKAGSCVLTSTRRWCWRDKKRRSFLEKGFGREKWPEWA